eukprot:1243746-Prymnesium_polylepis.1
MGVGARPLSPRASIFGPLIRWSVCEPTCEPASISPPARVGSPPSASTVQGLPKPVRGHSGGR